MQRQRSRCQRPGASDRVRATLLATSAVLIACVGLPGYPPEGEDATTTGGAPSSGESLGSTSMVDPSATSLNPDGTSSTASGSTTDVGPAGPFIFEESPLERYTQVDRIGFPLVNTVLNLLGDKDAYNQASPVDDAQLTFAPDVFTSLETLHLGAPDNQVPDNTGLDDDLTAFGLEPCIPPPSPGDTCDDQSGPFAIPDVLVLDLDDLSGFPNGRRLDDLAPDIFLAILLLSLDTHDVSTFYDLDLDGTPGPSLNPVENDVEFLTEFPYLAPPHD